MFAALRRRRGKLQIAKHEAKPTQNGQTKPPPVKPDPSVCWSGQPELRRSGGNGPGDAQDKAVRSTEPLPIFVYFISLTSIRFAFKIGVRNGPFRRAQVLCNSLVFKCPASDFRDRCLKCRFGKRCSYGKALPCCRACMQ